MLEHVKKYEKKFTITSPLFLACKKERKKENSISDRDKCLDKISNGSKCTLSDILDRWSSQGQDSIEWEKYKDENHKICGTTFTSNSLCSQNKSCEMEATRITPSLNDDFKKNELNKWYISASFYISLYLDIKQILML